MKPAAPVTRTGRRKFERVLSVRDGIELGHHRARLFVGWIERRGLRQMYASLCELSGSGKVLRGLLPCIDLEIRRHPCCDRLLEPFERALALADRLEQACVGELARVAADAPLPWKRHARTGQGILGFVAPRRSER